MLIFTAKTRLCWSKKADLHEYSAVFQHTFGMMFKGLWTIQFTKALIEYTVSIFTKVNCQVCIFIMKYTFNSRIKTLLKSSLPCFVIWTLIHSSCLYYWSIWPSNVDCPCRLYLDFKCPRSFDLSWKERVQEHLDVVALWFCPFFECWNAECVKFIVHHLVSSGHVQSVCSFLVLTCRPS